jgi:hypothetical protein
MQAVFNATSQNPNMDPPPADRLLARDKLAADAVPHDLVFQLADSHSMICRPFAFVQKDWILAQYQLFDATDLQAITRSCEGDLSGDLRGIVDPLTYEYDPSEDLPICNTCFWCKERQWATIRCQAVVDELRQNGQVTHER